LLFYWRCLFGSNWVNNFDFEFFDHCLIQVLLLLLDTELLLLLLRRRVVGLELDDWLEFKI
jgi:hypothetical protein